MTYRLGYSNELCTNHYKGFTADELAYMCYWYKKVSSREIALTLGRTQNSILNKVRYLRKKQEFDFYRKKFIKDNLQRN